MCKLAIFYNAINKYQDEKNKKLEVRIQNLEEENENLKMVLRENKDLRNEMNIIKAALNRILKEPHQSQLVSR